MKRRIDITVERQVDRRLGILYLTENQVRQMHPTISKSSITTKYLTLKIINSASNETPITDSEFSRLNTVLQIDMNRIGIRYYLKFASNQQLLSDLQVDYTNTKHPFIDGTPRTILELLRSEESVFEDIIKEFSKIGSSSHAQLQQQLVRVQNGVRADALFFDGPNYDRAGLELSLARLAPPGHRMQEPNAAQPAHFPTPVFSTPSVVTLPSVDGSAPATSSMPQ